MLEYTLDDANNLLDKNLDAANKSLAQVEEDLSLIRDQTTTLEVSILSYRIIMIEYLSIFRLIVKISGVDHDFFRV